MSNAAKRREAARLRMQRKTAREWAECKAARAEKHAAHTLEADFLRCKHQARVASPAEESADSILTLAPPRKKSAIHPSRHLGPAMLRHRQVESPRRLSDIAQDDDSDSSEGSIMPDDKFSSNSKSRARLPSPATVLEWQSMREAISSPPARDVRRLIAQVLSIEASLADQRCAFVVLYSTLTMANVSFCVPHYKPEPGHENKDVHNASPRARYYAVVSGNQGVMVTSECIARIDFWTGEAMERELKRDPTARKISAPTWMEIVDLWNNDCKLNHEHVPLHDLVTPESTPTRPPQLKARADRNSSPSKVVTKPLTTDEIAAKFEDFAGLPTKTISHRTLSPSKAAATRFTTNEVATKFEDLAVSPTNTKSRRTVFPTEAAATAHEQPLLLYGVTGHNRLFRSRECALVVLMPTPGADLVFAHDEAGVKDFIRTERARIMKPTS
ncbi:hypothetical protein K438DRAFT_1765815 [Mycena galopus ATCC 62051]|nr:hypothetical protein K438DRAFT_1765815 [Mycena galopus ATCC 62051]